MTRAYEDCDECGRACSREWLRSRRGRIANGTAVVFAGDRCALCGSTEPTWTERCEADVRRLREAVRAASADVVRATIALDRAQTALDMATNDLAASRRCDERMAAE